jgi:hypothetical protein
MKADDMNGPCYALSAMRLWVVFCDFVGRMWQSRGAGIHNFVSTMAPAAKSLKTVGFSSAACN